MSDIRKSSANSVHATFVPLMSESASKASASSATAPVHSDNSAASSVAPKVQSSSQSTKAVPVSAHNYLDTISNSARSADECYQKINSIASDIMKNSGDASSAAAQMNDLNTQINNNQLTITDSRQINKVSQLISVNLIKTNIQKIKALTAKNNISSVAFQAKINYKNYLRIQKAIQHDVNDINNVDSKASFSQGISTLNSHNSLVTSYANQLSENINNTNKLVGDASAAVNSATVNRSLASSAYDDISQMATKFQQRVANRIVANSSTTDMLNYQVAKLYSSADSYRQQIASVSAQYPKNSVLSNAYESMGTNVASLSNNNQLLSSVAAKTSLTMNTLNYVNISSLGSDYLAVSQATSQAKEYQSAANDMLDSIHSINSKARAASKALNAERAALNDGAGSYIPFNDDELVNVESSKKPRSYIMYYTRGYNIARKGFWEYLHQSLTKNEMPINANESYRIGFRNGKCFVQGINDARRKVIKNNQFVNNPNYNYGYNVYGKIVHNHARALKNLDTQLTLSYSLILVIGFLLSQKDN